MGERLTDLHPEVQVQKPFSPEIATFCDRYTSINTRRAYRRDLDAFSHFATGVKVSDLSQLTPDFIDKYLQYCEEQDFSNATIRRRVASLSSFLRRTGMKEFAKTVRKIRTEHIGGKPEMQPLRPLSIEEVGKLHGVSEDNPRA